MNLIKNVISVIALAFTLFITSALLIATTSALVGQVTSSSISSDELSQLQQAYSDKSIKYDYESADSFESALNNRINVANKIASFEVKQVAPDSIIGFNLLAGEHLNFRLKKAKDISDHDQATVIVHSAIKLLGSWFINCELIGVQNVTS